MEMPSISRVSATAVLFTYARAETGIASGTLGRMIKTGSADPNSFGSGLFVLTRADNPDQTDGLVAGGKRVLPASLVSSTEKVRDAAKRIIRDELGIERWGTLRETGIFDAIDRESDQRVISIAYWAFVPLDEIALVLGGRDKVGLELVSSLGTIERFKQSHDLDTLDGVSRFGYRYRPSPTRGHQKVLSKEHNGETILGLDYDDMVFYSWRAMRHGFHSQLDPFRYLGAQALPEEFSLTELREFYEACRGELISNDQFRRSMQRPDSYITSSGRTSDSSRQGRGKPAGLYTLENWARPDSHS